MLSMLRDAIDRLKSRTAPPRQGGGSIPPPRNHPHGGNHDTPGDFFSSKYTGVETQLSLLPARKGNGGARGGGG